MGGWKRFKERFAAKAPGHFKSSKAERIEKMYKEVTLFSKHVDKVESKIKKLQAATSEMLLTTEAALTAPLPHIYQATEASRGDVVPMMEGGGGVVATETAQQAPPPHYEGVPMHSGFASQNGTSQVQGSNMPTTVPQSASMATSAMPHSTSMASSTAGSTASGSVYQPRPLPGVAHSVNVGDLHIIQQQSESKMNADVITPVHEWLKQYRSFSGQLGNLERARLNFDAERRIYNKLELKRVRQQQAQDKVEPELASEINAKTMTLDEKRSIFTTHEQQVFENLSALVSDAKNLQHHIANALRIEEEVFKSSTV